MFGLPQNLGGSFPIVIEYNIAFFVKIEFVLVGKTKDRRFAEIQDEYLKRVRHYYPARIRVVAEQRRTDTHQQASLDRREAKLIEEKLSSVDYVIVLDERGEQTTSRDLARFLREREEQSTASVVFILGGHQGLSREIRDRSDRVLSLSRMTLPHEMARVVLLEQVYRAATILRGVPYHK